MFKIELILTPTKTLLFEGETISEALEKLSLEYRKLLHKTILHVTYNGVTVETIFYPRRIKLLMRNKTARLLLEKRLKMKLGIT